MAVSLKPQISKIISDCFLFSGLGPERIREIAQISTVRAYSRDETLFSEGDPAKSLYILIEGVVHLVKSSPEGKEQIIRIVKNGEVFAEAAVFSGENYPATAVSKANSELLLIDKEKFVKYVALNPQVAFHIIGVMARLLRHLNELLSDLTLGSVMTRLAAYLVCMLKHKGKKFIIESSKRELASSLGTVPETLSRNLKTLKKRGLIDVKGAWITIKDPKELEILAGK